MKIEIVVGSGIGLFAESLGEDNGQEKPISWEMREAAEKRWKAIVPRVSLPPPQCGKQMGREKGEMRVGVVHGKR